MNFQRLQGRPAANTKGTIYFTRILKQVAVVVVVVVVAVGGVGMCGIAALR